MGMEGYVYAGYVAILISVVIFFVLIVVPIGVLIMVLNKGNKARGEKGPGKYSYPERQKWAESERGRLTGRSYPTMSTVSRGSEKMRNFLTGLVIAIVGVIILVISLAILDSNDDQLAGGIIGFALIFLGPLIFWLIYPTLGDVWGARTKGDWEQSERNRLAKAEVNKQEKAGRADYFYNWVCMYSSRRDMDKCFWNLVEAISLDPSYREKAEHDKALEWARQDPRVRRFLGLASGAKQENGKQSTLP